MLSACLPSRQLFIREAFIAGIWYYFLPIRDVFGSIEPVTETDLCLFQLHAYWFEISQIRPITTLCKQITLWRFSGCYGMVWPISYPILTSSACVQTLYTFWKVLLYVFQCSVFVNFFINLALTLIPATFMNLLYWLMKKNMYCSPYTALETGPLRSEYLISLRTFDFQELELSCFFCSFPNLPRWHTLSVPKSCWTSWTCKCNLCTISVDRCTSWSSQPCKIVCSLDGSIRASFCIKLRR